MREDVAGLATDLGEVVLDSVLDDGLLKDIPVLGSIAKLASIGQTVQDRLFRAKVMKFMGALTEIPSDQLVAFRQELESDERRSKIGEKLLLLLNAQDDLEKCSIVGFLFRQRINGELTEAQFERYAAIVSRLYLDDLLHFGRINLHDSFDSCDEMAAALGACGLMQLEVETLVYDEGRGVDGINYYATYVVSEFGKKLSRLILEYEASKETC